MTHMTSLFAAAVAGTSLALTSPATAQNDALVQDLRFTGGTLADFVGMLDEQNGDYPVNVLYRNGAENVSVDSIRLAWVEVEAALSAVADMSGLALGVKPGGQGVPVFIISRPSPGPFQPEGAIDTHIIPLGAKLDITGDALVHEVEVVASAVQLALEGEATPELKLHPPTGLLIARGTRSQIHTVTEVIDQMSQAYKRRSAESYELERSRINAEAQLRQVDTELHTAMEAYSLASQEYKEMQALADNGAMSATEVKRGRMRLIEKEGEIKRLEVQLELARKELELLEERTARAESRDYRRSMFFGAESSAVEAIKALGRASQTPVSVNVGDNVVQVRATGAQHEAIQALLGAMEAARPN